MDDLADNYASALKAYLSGSGELALLHAYELGRQALAQGVGIIEMAEQHHRAMKSILLDTPQDRIAQVVRQAAMFYEESLAPFEIAHRSFRDATENSQRFIHLSSMAFHELKSSATSILASAGMLEELLYADRRDPVSRLLANLLKGSSILKLHTDDLMNIIGFYTGAIPIRVQPLDMTAFLHQVYEYLQPEVIQHHLLFFLDISPDLPLTEGDPDRLQQVLANLIQNAVKYAGEGTSIELAGHAEQDCLVIEVRDDGKGVTAEDGAVIFQMYRRVSHDSQHIPGLGIGLVLCRQIVEAHSGTIGLISQPGQGSVFQIRLPLPGKRLVS
jgi:signal transduction histidine kinase